VEEDPSTQGWKTASHPLPASLDSGMEEEDPAQGSGIASHPLSDYEDLDVEATHSGRSLGMASHPLSDYEDSDDDAPAQGIDAASHPLAYFSDSDLEESEDGEGEVRPEEGAPDTDGRDALGSLAEANACTARADAFLDLNFQGGSSQPASSDDQVRRREYELTEVSFSGFPFQELAFGLESWWGRNTPCPQGVGERGQDNVKGLPVMVQVLGSVV
jgi:hypothetical protein